MKNWKVKKDLNAERAIPNLKWVVLSEDKGMLVSDGEKKPHLMYCEAICVHEEVAKRIPNVRFTKALCKRSAVL